MANSMTSGPTATTTPTDPASSFPTTKLLKLSSLHDLDQPLLPGLPDHIAQLCLSLVHPSFLYSVCRSWRRLIYSPSFPPYLSLYALLSSSSSSSQSAQSQSDAVDFFTFDPISSSWHLLPPPPPDPPLRVLLHHPSFISRNLPIQSVSVSGNLILLAATTHNFLPALSHPLIFSPLSTAWALGPPLATPRRWCAAGAVQSAVYVASGMGSHFFTDTARSVEKWDLHLQDKNDGKPRNFGWMWERKSGLKDGRFSREAIDAIGWRGKLCMVNVRGDAAKEGAVYDVEKDAWEEMPEGMLAGWRGPVAAMDEEVMYALDEAKGALRKYVPERDAWDNILESERLRGAQQMAAGGGRVCVVCRGGAGIVVLDVVASLRRSWVVDVPAGLEAVAVHILPRMNRLGFGFPVLEYSTSSE
ncbi:F-box/kelch-repeat protein SKIP25 [Juglans microcarpa x Juglans regia]|uniref:F-box/kelch-repeat protein SKIP25 n=1 Tax=Juglans microcarpa x Juglans regia TaxID=2249226 RepID=UPI001B7DEC47|nr:F-box/kelch-repeat protein SKIP25 [Juglans microcarpa x Juglans regia]